MNRWTTAVTASIAAMLVLTPSAFGLVLNQLDTFEDGTTQGWVVGIGPVGGSPGFTPTNVASGGPQGLNDNFLMLTSIGGSVPGGRLVGINANQWAGDYLAAGIGAIQMSVLNTGGSDLHLRLLFEDPIPGPPVNIAVSSESILVPSGSGWQTVMFSITPGSLTALAGDTSLALSNATVFRLFSSDTAVFPPAPIVASLGVDNIRALPPVVPEPATALLLAAAGIAVAFRRRKIHQD